MTSILVSGTYRHLRDELVCRCASFISKCLLSDSGVVRALARNGVYFMRMLSPIGVNSQLCRNYYGLSLLNIHSVCKPLAWFMFRQSVLPELNTIYTIKELLHVKFGFYPRDAMLARVIVIATCPSVCLSHAGIVLSLIHI